MNELIAILASLQPDINYESEKALIDNHLLDSLTILSLIVELEDAFDITIPSVEITADNFNSAEAIWTMIVRLQEEG